MSNFDTHVEGHHLEAAVVTHPRPGVRVVVDGHVRFIEARPDGGEPRVHHHQDEADNPYQIYGRVTFD